MQQLPVTYSTFSADAIGQEVARAYGIGVPATSYLLKRGINDTYLVAPPRERYIARVYRTRWRSASEIAYELALLRHLSTRGMRVAAPIAGLDGALARPLIAPEGERQLVLFAYATGNPLSGKNEEHNHLAGRTMAQIHTAADDFDSEHGRARLDLASLIDGSLAAARPFLAERPKAWDYLEGVAARLRKRAEAAISTGLDWGVCHGDLGLKNLLIDDEGRVTALDFDHCGVGWRVYDFAPLYGNAVREKRPELWEVFLKGYREVRPVSATDVAAVPVFRALRHLSMLGMFAHNAADWGFQPIRDSNLDGWLQFFREWEAEHGQA